VGDPSRDGRIDGGLRRVVVKRSHEGTGAFHARSTVRFGERCAGLDRLDHQRTHALVDPEHGRPQKASSNAGGPLPLREPLAVARDQGL
jgi:hypothetical protein